MNYKPILRWLILLLVFAALVWYLASTINVGVLIGTVNNTNLALLLVVVPVITISHIVRAQRWRLLLAHLPDTVSIWKAFSSIMIGYAANTFVPRSGEFIRPLVVAHSTKMPYATALGSVVVERVLDVVSLLVAVFIVLGLRSSYISSVFPTVSTNSILATLVLPAAIGAGLLSVLVFTNYGTTLTRWLTSPLPNRFQQRILTIVEQISQGAASVRKVSAWPMIVIYTALMWLFYILPVWMIIEAMSLGHIIGFADAAMLLVVIAIAVTIAPTPGALGVYQTLAQLALVTLYGTTQEQGLAFGVLSWVINYGLAVLVGGFCLIIESRNGFSIRGAFSKR